MPDSIHKQRLILALGILAATVAIAATAVVFPGGRANGGIAQREVHVAVASNFAEAMKDIARRFEAHTGNRVMLSNGSTGQLYAQIKHGAPFDAFFAADRVRPKQLEVEGLAVSASRFTYASGRIVLWSPTDGYVDPRGDVLRTASFSHLALANPRLAPYGEAARDVLQALGLWDRLQAKIVRGENISQTMQFVRSGSAELGFVAGSQVRRQGREHAGSCWEIPQALYAPIEQQAVLLQDHPVARVFLEFVRSDEALAVISSYGYGAP